jgi:hypothetical protein
MPCRQSQPFGQQLDARPLLKPNNEKGRNSQVCDNAKAQASLQLSMPKADLLIC